MAHTADDGGSVEAAVRQCVKDNTDVEEPVLSISTALLAMLQDPARRPLVYECLLDRMRTQHLQHHHQLHQAAGQQPAADVQKRNRILLRVVKILKNRMVKYPPDTDFLVDLQSCCADLCNSHDYDKGLTSQFRHLQLAVGKALQHRQNSAGSSTGVQSGGDASSSRPGSAQAAVRSSPTPPPRNISENSAATPQRLPSVHTSTVREVLPESVLFKNVLSMRAHSISGQKKKKMAALLMTDLFGGHIQHIVGAGGKRAIELKHCFALADPPGNDIIEEILASRKNDTEKAETEPQEQPLFQYKHYAEQKPLVLQQEELGQIMDVITGVVPADTEDVLSASKVLIKICIDQYCAGDPVSVEELLSVFLEMIERGAAKSVKVARHAFDLLLNLGLHAHLLEEIWANTGNTAHESDKEPGVMMAMVVNDLMIKFEQMCLWLTLSNIEDEATWNAALTCFVTFSITDGIIDRRRALLDSRVYVGFLQRLPHIRTDLESALIACLVNSLYSKGTNDLHMPALAKIGGINVVIDLYVGARAVDAKNSLFLVIYDYIAIRLADRKVFDATSEQRGLILDFLRSVDTSQFVGHIFTDVPESFVERFVRYVYIEELKKDPEWSRTYGRLDKTALVAILYDLEQLAHSFCDLSPELLSWSIPSETARLKCLLFSSHPEERRQGQLCLARFFIEDMDTRGLRKAEECNDLFSSLLTSTSVSIRFGYIVIVRKIIMHRRYLISQGKGDVESLLDVLNVMLSRLVDVDERDPRIIKAAVDIMATDLMFVPAAEKMPFEMESQYSSVYEGALQGKYLVRRDFLSVTSMKLLQHFFKALVGCDGEPIRAVLMHLIMEGCRVASSADSIGGMGFFKDAAMDADPLIAYLACVFLVEQLSHEKPTQYQMLVKKISQRMKITEDDFLHNPYIQVHSIMGLSRPRKE